MTQPPPSQFPDQNSGQFPGQNPGQWPGQFPGQNPSQFPGQFQGQYPGQNPGQTQGQFPGQTQGQFPGQFQGQAQGQFPGQFQGQAQGQFPGQYPGQPYYPQPFPPPRRGGTGRTVAIVLGSVLAGLIVIGGIAAALGGHKTTPGASGPGAGGPGAGGPSAPVTSPAAASSPATTAPPTGGAVGSTIPLTGLKSSERMAVTIVKVIADARPATSFDAASHGKRLYAVQIRLQNIGTAPYSDAPSNSAVITDNLGQSYQASFSNVQDCQSYPGSENIAAGSTGLGCVVFEIPAGVKITGVQFTLDSGFADQTGHWKV
jgi:Domain of unknown function (DUF4352)